MSRRLSFLHFPSFGTGVWLFRTEMGPTVVEIIFKVGHNLREFRETLFQSAATEDNSPLFLTSSQTYSTSEIFMARQHILYSLLPLDCDVNLPNNKRTAQVQPTPSAHGAR